MNKLKLVVLTGAGISAESGLKTFRDSDGLWEGYRVEDVATPEAWSKDPEMVQTFYNLRRKAVIEASPNEGHYALAGLEKDFDVTIITQNIDNLHERAGSSKVVHLHGEITLAQSTYDPSLLYPVEGWELGMDSRCELGYPLRPFVVWFGESVPKITEAAAIAGHADVFAVIGTSLVVYPAAGLVHAVNPAVPVYVVDPGEPALSGRSVTFIREKASSGVPRLAGLLRELHP